MDKIYVKVEFSLIFLFLLTQFVIDLRKVIEKNEKKLFLVFLRNFRKILLNTEKYLRNLVKL